MITNFDQYCRTIEWADTFEAALELPDNDALDEWQQRILREGMTAQLETLREQIAEYEERQRQEEFERDY
jgi:hypothetical protein